MKEQNATPKKVLADEIIIETEYMRQLQRTYFLVRTPDNLMVAKDQEAKVDRMIREYKSDSSQQNIF